jgi:hypothetical protein
LSLEKYIADHQNPLQLQKKRSEQLLHQTLQDISVRAQSKMRDPSCQEDLNELDHLLKEYFEHNMKLIEVQHRKSSAALRDREREEREGTLTKSLKEHQAKAQNLKKNIEEYVYNLQLTTRCHPSKEQSI